MAFCVPKKYTRAFEKAFRPDPKTPGEKGPLHPDRLRTMTAEARRNAIKKEIGVDDDFAREVNLKYEKQLLLKDQKKAMTNFINDMQGLNSKVKKDLVDQVMSLQTAISPKNVKAFLEDFTAKKIGAEVSHEEAVKMLDLAKTADKSKEAWKADLGNEEKRQAFGVDLVRLNDYTNSLKDNNMSGWDKALNVLNLPKHAAATLDLSSTLVQMSSMITSKRFWEGFIEQFKYAYDEEAFEKLRGDIITHPYYELSQKAKLGLGNISDKLKPNEEYLQSSLLEQGNEWLKKQSGGLVPNVIRGADRAFIGYVNYVRFKTFTDLVDAGKLIGEDMSMGSTAVRDIAENVNTFTGRGNVGLHDNFGNTVPFINLFTWTIRKVSSTLTLMSPVPFMKSSPTARAFATRQLMGYLTATATLYGSARMMLGADAVPIDPSDAHFGWIKVGKTWMNPLGDRPTYARLWWRLATARTINAAGVESRYGRSFADMAMGNHPTITDKNTTRAGLLGRFSRAKLNPTFSILIDALSEKDFMGENVGWDVATLKRQAESRLLPMGMSSFYDVVQNDPDNTVGQVLAMGSLFGSSVYVDTPKSKAGLTAWGDSLADAYNDKSIDVINKKLLDINESMKFPPKTINKVPLTDKQYHDYIVVFGQAAKQQLSEVIESGEWDSSTDEEKKEGWKNALKIARKMASVSMMLNSQDDNDGENNPIFDQMQPSDSEAGERGNVQRLEKSKDNKAQKVLTAPVASEAEMRKQWAQLQIQDYDYGRMIQTNPLAYLGYMAVKNEGVAKYWNRNVTVLGETFTGNNPQDDFKSDPESYKVQSAVLKEAGIDPKSAKGHIILGPEFGEGKNTYTLEHELMHRGVMELLKAGNKTHIEDETMISGFQHLYGNDKHSTELANDPFLNRVMNNEEGATLVQRMTPKDRASWMEKAKILAHVFKDDIDEVQNKAKELIAKRNK